MRQLTVQESEKSQVQLQLPTVGSLAVVTAVQEWQPRVGACIGQRGAWSFECPNQLPSVQHQQSPSAHQLQVKKQLEAVTRVVPTALRVTRAPRGSPCASDSTSYPCPPVVAVSRAPGDTGQLGNECGGLTSRPGRAPRVKEVKTCHFVALPLTAMCGRARGRRRI